MWGGGTNLVGAVEGGAEKVSVCFCGWGVSRVSVGPGTYTLPSLLVVVKGLLCRPIMSGFHTLWLEPGLDSRFRAVSVFGLALNNLSDGAVSQEPNTSCMASKSRTQGCVLIKTGEYTVKDINRAAWEGSLLAFGLPAGD